ncbi:MAG: hypothetical protein E7080_03760 [Bacteroidales bacterium]|nr:hypothetical protein [Bacteroidales bacterium]
MKKLMYFAFAIALLSSCSKTKGANEMLAEEEVLQGDSVIEIIGEWIEVPINDTHQTTTPTKKVKFNRDKTMEGTPEIKKEKKKNRKNQADSITVTTMVYQMWDQMGDTITMISQSAVDPQLQDTVSWGIVTLTSDSLKLHNATQGAKNYIRNK